jgi:transcriptional regulator with XRE-family HTH domain
MKNASTYSMIVAQIVSERRDATHMTQEDFLQKAEMSQSSWSRITRGISFFTLEELRIVCKVLNVSVSDIISKADEITEKLEENDDVEILETKKAKDNEAAVRTIIAGAALAFLVTRLMK